MAFVVSCYLIRGVVGAAERVTYPQFSSPDDDATLSINVVPRGDL